MPAETTMTSTMINTNVTTTKTSTKSNKKNPFQKTKRVIQTASEIKEMIEKGTKTKTKNQAKRNNQTYSQTIVNQVKRRRKQPNTKQSTNHALTKSRIPFKPLKSGITNTSCIKQPSSSSHPIFIHPQKPVTVTSTSSSTESTMASISIQCWAHTQSGHRCTNLVSSREGEPVPIPYCETHLKCGDGALKVVEHPFAGKCLVARFDLPPKYRIAFWGIRGKCNDCDKEDRAISFYPPNRITGRNTRKLKDGKIITNLHNYNGVLNPEGTGDIVQYAACPGPNERQNMRSTFRYWGLRNGVLGGLEFITLQAVPKNTQLCHWYGSGWWSARGIKRRDVGTNQYPAPKRKKLLDLD